MKVMQLHLALMRGRGFDPNVGRILDELQAAVRKADERLSTLKATAPDDYYDIVVDEESEFVEAVAGSAFVVAQAYITGIVSSVKGIAAALPASSNGLLPGGKGKILRLA